MRAWILHDIAQITYDEVQKPLLKKDEVLVGVKSVGICGSDIPRIYQDGAHQMPLIPGHEFAGEVVEIGRGANEKWQGKRVGIFPLIPCGQCIACKKGRFEMCRSYSYLGSRRDGGFAEYVAVPEKNLIELPEQVTYEQAAMLEPMAVAVHAMRRVGLGDILTAVNDKNNQNMKSYKFGEISGGDKEINVAVCGLGTIGTLLVMLLLEWGVKNLFVIGNKEFQREKMKDLGLPEEQYCDSKKENVKDWMNRVTCEAGADVFFECVGRNETVSLAVDVAAPGGSICMVGNPYTDMTLKKDVYWKILRNQLSVTGTWNSSFFDGKDFYMHSADDSEYLEADQRVTDWQYVLDLLEKERIKPEQFISHRYELKDLERGLHIMRDKSEDYIKVMIEIN